MNRAYRDANGKLMFFAPDPEQRNLRGFSWYRRRPSYMPMAVTYFAAGSFLCTAMLLAMLAVAQ